MLRKLKPKSEFSRNILTLMTGTTIAQAIPIAISPILTRIYTPEEFGIFALFLAIYSVLSSLSTGKYESAIILPKKDSDAFHIASLALIINTIVSLLTFILISIFHNEILVWISNDKLEIWIYFIPVFVFFTGIYNILNSLNLRLEKYRTMSKVQVIRSLTTGSTQLILGFLKVGSSGLIFGQIMSLFVGNYALYKSTKEKINNYKFSIVKVKLLSKKYIKFPKYSLPANFISSSNQEIFSIVLSILYSTTILGYYHLVKRILALPTKIIGGAIRQVFLREAAKKKNIANKADIVFLKFLQKIIIVSLPIYIILFFVVEDLFVIVFGDNWKEAGEYAKVLLPLFFTSFVVSPLSGIDNIFDKNQIGFLWQIGYFIILVIIFMFSYIINISINEFWIIYMSVFIIYYIFLLLLSYKISKGVI